MQESKKERCDVRNGYAAMDRIEEAGELIEGLLGDHAACDAVNVAYMDLMMESIEIGYELRDRHSPETVKRWIELKRDILFAELKRRGLDHTEDAQCAIRKIGAVLRWVDDWQRQTSENHTAAESR